MNATLRRIEDAADRPNEARDVLEEKLGRLDYDLAREISEAAFSEELAAVPVASVELLYGTAYDATEAEEGEENWLAIFNEYEDLLHVVAAVQTSAYSVDEHPLKPLAAAAASAGGSTTAVFSAFRKHPDMSEDEGRELLELLYPTAVATLDQAARRALFTYAHERGSAEGWNLVATYYDTAAAIANLVKLPASLREEVRAKRGL